MMLTSIFGNVKVVNKIVLEDNTPKRFTSDTDINESSKLVL
jgi:hypothetical protein